MNVRSSAPPTVNRDATSHAQAPTRNATATVCTPSQDSSATPEVQVTVAADNEPVQIPVRMLSCAVGYGLFVDLPKSLYPYKYDHAM